MLSALLPGVGHLLHEGGVFPSVGPTVAAAVTHTHGHQEGEEEEEGGCWQGDSQHQQQREGWRVGGRESLLVDVVRA